jgi:hypothetical protein
MMEEEEAERTLCQLPQVYVFKIPARKSAGKFNITSSLFFSYNATVKRGTSRFGLAERSKLDW